MKDLRDVTPEKILEIDKKDPVQRKRYLRMMTSLRVGFGLERAMHAHDIDIPLEKVDLLWRSICETFELPEWMLLDYAKRLRQSWGCDKCKVVPCDPSVCQNGNKLGSEVLSKIGDENLTEH